MFLDHVAIHVCDVREFLVAVGATVGSGGVKVKVGFVIKAPCASGAALGEANNKKRGGVVGVDVLHVACQMGFVG